MSAPIAFAYMDTFRATGEMEEYAELNRSIFPYLYKADDVAGCYCNFAAILQRNRSGRQPVPAVS